jgi:protein-S-isoprenylcysteine O-methyltransferase Ste14
MAMSSTRAAPKAAGLRDTIRNLVGSGDRIMLFTLPFVAVGVVIQHLAPSLLSIDGSWMPLRVLALVVLGVGLVVWAWSVALILTKVPRGELITSGPYAVVKHPLYTSVALLVLPAAGILLNTWLGVVIGLGLYLASRRYSPDEESALEAKFGAAWEAYERRVLLPWL